MGATIERNDEMVQAYLSGETAKSAAAKFGLSKATCLRELRRRQIPTRESRDYSAFLINEVFFKVIDTEEKAYWLGFLVADGCVSSNRIRIALQANDRAHLELFLKHLGASSNIRDYVTKASIGPQGHRIEPRPVCSVAVSSRAMAQDLARHGVIPKKSLVAEPWHGPDTLMRHYWRGVIDGDGSIFQSAQGKWVISLIGSRAMVEKFRDWACVKCGTKANIALSGNAFTFTIGGQKVPQLLVEALYGNCTVALKRKQLVANELMALSLSGVNGRRTDIDWCQVRREYEQGISASELGARNGCYHHQIIAGLRRMGVEPRTRSAALEASRFTSEKGRKGSNARWNKEKKGKT